MYLAIFAGRGDITHRLILKCINLDIKIIIITFEDLPEFSQYGNYFNCNIGEVGKLIDQLHRNEITHITFIGKIDRPNFLKLKVDFLGAKLLKKIIANKIFGDSLLLKIVTDFLTEQDFKIIPAQNFLSHILTPKKIITNSEPNEQNMRDIELAMHAAYSIGLLDLGQGAICVNNNVIAVEDILGTDSMLERFINHPEKTENGVLVKLLKPIQDDRTDLPTIGIKTLELAHIIKLKGIGLSADKSFIVDMDKVVKKADEYNIFIMGL